MVNLGKLITAVLIAITLTACGGGGGGSAGNITVTPTPTGPSVSGSIRTSALTSSFTSKWNNINNDTTRNELNDMYALFKEVEKLQESGITSADLSNVSGTININGTNHSVSDAWLYIVGFKHRYYDGKERVWRRVKTHGGFDDESTEYIA